ncbi:MAG: carbamoyltransferase [Candidatus Pacebacteria bacterium]|nr:carbamoyltransferase [Candidatus Paceibacterota bacterium]
MPSYILGISCFYHDSAAALLKDGEILAAAQEERFTRKKHDSSFPKNAVNYCLKQAGIEMEKLEIVSFYEKPFLKFERLLETYLQYSPKGINSFTKAMTVWLKQKLWMKELIKKELGFEGKILFPEHHQSHASSAFFPSPFCEAAFLTMDGVGEWATSSYGIGRGNKIKILAELNFPHSLGLLYSAFTYYTGFKVNSGEYKVMGLAPYGEGKYKDLILSEIIDLKEDGSFRLNMDYFNYGAGLTMTSAKFHKLFGGPPRKGESDLTQKEMDLARSIQEVTEEIVLKMAQHIKKETGQEYLCLAGGVALNCVANGKLLRTGLFKDIWIQPAAGDAGGALGAALFAHYQYLANERKAANANDFQKGSFLGPGFGNLEIQDYLEKNQIPYHQLNFQELLEKTADLIANQKVVGWFQGRMEFGPRALGARSILGDARSSQMQKILNLKIKFRESFRPFAPSVLAEKVRDYFEIDRESPYMLLTAQVKKELVKEMTKEQERLFGLDKLHVVRSSIPAVTHIDYSARLQTVNNVTNPLYHRLLEIFNEKYNCPIIINTSFNVRGEPIVCAPKDAYLCFMRTEMDYLAMGNFLLDKNEQKPLQKDSDWKKEFQLD